MTKPRYKRILLKLSGEALMGDQGYGIDHAVLDSITSQVKEVYDLGVEIAIVIGGGNIFRGLSGAAKGHGTGERRLHGHACYRPERAGPPERP